jgi:hypothetical protein
LKARSASPRRWRPPSRPPPFCARSSRRFISTAGRGATPVARAIASPTCLAGPFRHSGDDARRGRRRRAFARSARGGGGAGRAERPRRPRASPASGERPRPLSEGRAAIGLGQAAAADREKHSDLLPTIRSDRLTVALSALRHVASDCGWLECLRYFGHLVLDESLESKALPALERGGAPVRPDGGPGRREDQAT